MKKNLPLFEILWDREDIKSIEKIIRRGSYWADGPEILEFEERLSNYFSKNHCVTFNSGTSALHSVLLAYGLTSGEVLVPTLSFISTANCVLLAGAKPVFIESEEETLGLDPEDLLKKINNNTKAIIPMHYGGRTCKKIQEIKEIASDHNLLLIEDNAESLGSSFNNKLAGTFGDASMLSFCQNKIISTGEGGAIITDDEEVYKKLKLIRSHGRVQSQTISYFSDHHIEDYIDIGYNFRMPTICAALGISQLNRINSIIKKRQDFGNYYDINLKKVKRIKILKNIKEINNVYQLYTIILENSEERNQMQEFLNQNGIMSKVYFDCIHLKTYYREKFGYSNGDLPKTENISNKLLTIPMLVNSGRKAQEYIISKLIEFFN